MQVEITAATGVPAGSYPCEFVRAEPFNENVDQYGPAVKLVWRIPEGEQEGNEASRICSLKTSPKSNLFKFIKALSGREPEPGEKIELNSYAGTAGLIVVEEVGESTRVSTFLKSA